MYKLPPAPASDWHGTVTLGMQCMPLSVPPPSPQPLAFKFWKGLATGSADTAQVAAPVGARYCGLLPSLDMKIPISYLLALPKLTVICRSSVMLVPPAKDVRSLTTDMPVI